MGTWAWALPDIAETPLFGAWRDVAYGMVVWVLIASGVVGVVFGSATVLNHIDDSMSLGKSAVAGSSLVEHLQRGFTRLITTCLAIIGPLVWAFAVTTGTQFLSPSRLCASGRALRSQWLPNHTDSACSKERSLLPATPTPFSWR